MPELSEKARRQLIALGVDVRTGAKVTNIDEWGVSLGDEHVAARTVLWAAGVTGSRLGRSLGVPLDRANRVVVNPDLSLPGHPEAYVIGDLASLTQEGRVGSGRGAGGDARGASRDEKHPALDPWRDALAVPVPQQGVAGHDRAQSRGGPAWHG